MFSAIIRVRGGVVGGIKPLPSIRIERGWDMPVSKKQQASVNKYIKEKYDTYRLTMPKGKKAELQAHASERGESLNGFVNRAIDYQMERDKMPESALEAFIKKNRKEGQAVKED